MSYAAPQGKFAKRLKKDKDKWRAEMSAADEACSDAKEQEYGCFRAVRAERLLEEAQKNARRYLWLKDNKIAYVAGDDDMQRATMEWCIEVASLAPSTLDEAIDREMKDET